MHMNIGDVTILALVQGLTEFLPVSSSGHLVAVRVLFGISDDGGTAFDAFLHMGTLLAVFVFYWRTWWGMARGVFFNDIEGRDKRQLLAKLAIATVPGAVAGYVLQGQSDAMLRSPQIVAVGLLLTAAALFFMDMLAKRAKTIARANFKDAFLIGLAQIVALVPGVSRSGMTIAAGRARGLSRKQAATFSFLLSAPIIAGAGLATVGSLVFAGTISPGQLAAGFLISFVAGLVAIYSVLKIVEKISFWPFAVYLVGLAAVLFYAQ